MYKSPSKFSFWFLLLNCLLFLPYFLMDIPNSNFFPIKGENESFWDFLFFRENIDLFRIQAEFFLMTIFGIFLIKKGKSIKLFRRLFIGLYLFQFFIHLYEAAIYKIYCHDPLLFDDLILAKNVLPIFLLEFSFGNLFMYVLAILVFFLLFYGLALLLKTFLNTFHKELSPLWIPLVGGILLCSTAYNWNTKELVIKEQSNWFIKKITRNTVYLYDGLDKRNIAPADKKDYVSFEKLAPNKLNTKPNVYLIFVESYGSVLYRKEGLKSSFYKNLKEYQRTLKTNGFSIGSNFSNAINSGGKSWFGYTSSFTGIKIENQRQYDHLVYDHPDYPHLIRYFNFQGYDTYRMNTIRDEKTRHLIPFAAYEKFYNFDHWIKYEDIPYEGQTAKEFSTIPDQYALNYFKNNLILNSNKPSFLFFITMSSHSPWINAVPFVEDWNTLDQLNLDYEKPTGLLPGFDSKAYLKAMNYQWDYLVDFMIKNEEENAVYILIGDHQPPLITGLKDGYATPLHIISKNKEFVNAFYEDGFQNGLTLKEYESDLNHEDLYELLIQKMSEVFGEN